MPPAPPEVTCYALDLTTRFRGLTRRQGLVWRGPAGWAEWSPFLDYGGAELVPWLQAAEEAAETGWPAPVRTVVPVNSIVPAVSPDHAYAHARAGGCRTAKVKVAEAGQSLADDVARVEAVRDALGPDGRVRVDANGTWDPDQAWTAIAALRHLDLEYVEQPCATVEQLAELRRRLARAGRHVLIAADESIRRAADPYRVRQLEAADIAVLKVQPLGGVRACLEIAERIGWPVVVSSALESSIGLRAGLALAAALPELPYACGLGTAELLVEDLVVPPLRPRAGELTVRDVAADPDALEASRATAEETAFWQARLMQTREQTASHQRRHG